MLHTPSPGWSIGSRVALACGGLERGLGSQLEIEAGSQRGEHQMLATRPVVSDKGPDSLALQKRIPKRWKVMNQIKYLLRGKKSKILVDSHTGGLQECCWVASLWQFELLLCGISSGFPLANHSDLPGSQSIFGISQDPHMCAHASLSHNGFYQKGIRVEHPLTYFPFDLQGTFSVLVWLGRSPDFEKRNMWWSGQGPASSLNCPAYSRVSVHEG